MGSSGGGGGNPQALMGNSTPMKGLPIAGEGGGVGDPREYGTFQSFLPDVQAEGPNPMATGLRPDMFQYKKPTGVLPPRDELAQVIAPQKASNVNPEWVRLRSQMSPRDLQIFQGQVSPEEFSAFMSATSGDEGNQFGAGGAGAKSGMLPGGFADGAYPNNAGG